MTTKRKRLLALTLLAVIGGVIAYSLLRQDDEPTYQGRRLSEWLEHFSQTHLYSHESEAAVQNVGTGAVPYLLKWINYETPAWRTTLRDKLPASVVYRPPFYGWIEGEGSRRAEYAMWGFFFLRTNAVSAIPGLEALMKDTTKPETSIRAAHALTIIGEPALPALKAAIANTNRSDHLRIIGIFGQIPGSLGTNVWLPIMLEAINDHDPVVRRAAMTYVGNSAPEAIIDSTPK